MSAMPDLPPGVAWSSAVEDFLPAGAFGLWQAGVSTRRLAFDHEPGRLQLTMYAGACLEDWDLAIDVIEAAAIWSDNAIAADFLGAVEPAAMRAALGRDLQYGQLLSSVRTMLFMAAEKGPISIPGPARRTVIGPRVIAELGPHDDVARAERFVSIMRRVQWPPSRYESATSFDASGNGAPYTLCIWQRTHPCLLPATDRLVLPKTEHERTIVVPRACLDELPGVEARYVDDGNQLVEPVRDDAWGAVRARAAELEIRT